MTKKDVVSKKKNNQTKNKKKNKKLPKRKTIICGPRSTWIIYLDHIRKQKMEEHQNLNFGMLCKLMSPIWKNMNIEEKQKYIDEHKTDILRYYNDVSNLSDADRKILKAHKRLRRKNQKKKPKMPMTAYMRFANVERSNVTNEQPTIKFHEIGRELGKRWRSLSDTSKDHYKQEAARERAMVKLQQETEKTEKTEKTENAVE